MAYYNTHASNWGWGMMRSMYPSSMGGPFGNPAKPLPNFQAYPGNSAPKLRQSPTYTGSGNVSAPVVADVTISSSFGSPVYEMPRRRVTPGGMGTSDPWGYMYGRRKSKRRRKSKSRKRLKKRRKSKKRRRRRRSRK